MIRSNFEWLNPAVPGCTNKWMASVAQCHCVYHGFWQWYIKHDPANRLKPEHPHTWDDKLHSFHCDAVDKVVRCKTCSYHAFVSPIPTNIAKVTWHQCDKPAKCSICFHHFSFIVTRNAIGMQYSLIFTMNAVPLSWKWRLSRWSQWKSVVAPSVEGRSDPRAWRAAPHLRIPFPIR